MPGDGCRLAVSGFNNRTDDTFIDIFALSKDPNFRDVSSLRSPRPYFSREFTKSEGSSWPRYVCLLGDSVFVTCCGDTIELHDTEHGGLVNLRKFTRKASCMAVDGRIYVGLYNSTDLIVFDLRLNQINRITLQRLRERDYPWDMTVNNNNLFICTYHHYGRAFMSNTNGEFQHQYKKPNRQYWGAWSITFCEENGLVYVLWYGGGGKRVVVVYYFSQERSSLPVSHSSLPSSHSSLSDGHCLAAFNVPFDLLRIRRNSNTNTLFAVTRETGEVYEYDTVSVQRITIILLVAIVFKVAYCKLWIYKRLYISRRYFASCKICDTVHTSSLPSFICLVFCIAIKEISCDTLII